MRRWKDLLKFMTKRHEIYRARQEGKPAPWTRDPILREYKFTNVYRELDRVTVWVDQHIRKPYKDHPHLWFMLAMARQINWPPMLQDLMKNSTAWPHEVGRWDHQAVRKVMLARKARGEQCYTGAYMLNAHGFEKLNTTDRDKALFTSKLVLESVWRNRLVVEPELHDTMERAHKAFLPYHGWGGFTAYEVVCDLRYTRYLEDAKDKFTWAHAGPGAKRGLNRLLGLPLKQPISDRYALEKMRELHEDVGTAWMAYPPLEMREIEHSLCEFDKYERVRLGEGRPRSKFKPTLEGF